MALFVHIADAKAVPSIRRAGIKPSKWRSHVYFMPVVQSHFISHQWLRELRRRGARVLVGVYFKLRDEESVWAGRYNEQHKELKLSEAINLLNNAENPLGFEMMIARKIAPSEIHSIRQLPQTVGWRFLPGAHGTTPCPCPMCQRGRIKAQRIRVLDAPPKPTPFDQVIAILRNPNSSIDDVIDNLYRLRNKRRVIDPSFLEPLLVRGNAEVLEEIAWTLPYIRHPYARTLLSALSTHENGKVRQAANEAVDDICR
jgi:hypothetical protein